MSMLRQKRKEFASVLEKACKQTATSTGIDSSGSPFPLEFADECADSQWRAGSAVGTPQISPDSVLSTSWPESIFGGDLSMSSQFSPCIDGDSWPSADGYFSCPWNPSTDLEFLEADTADQLLSRAITAGPEITQTSMDLLDFLDGQTQTINHLGACLDIEDCLFRGGCAEPSLAVISDLTLDLQQPDCLKSDAWLHDPSASDSDLDELLVRPAAAAAKAGQRGFPHPHPHPSACRMGDVPQSCLSKGLPVGRVVDRVTKKHSDSNKNISQAELLFRKERNRLRSKAYRLRRKMQFESMKKEVSQARQKMQEAQEQMQN